MDASAYSFWEDVTIMLAAVAFVGAAFRMSGWNPILGLMAAGAALGPHGFHIVGETSAIEFMSELGIMFLLFAVGLELSFDRIRAMARWIFGLGSLHFLLCGAALAGLSWAIGSTPYASIAIGVALALSSTAFVLQILSERGELTAKHGRGTFSVLLFQDIMVAPILALIPFLALLAMPDKGAQATHSMPMLAAVVSMFVLFMVARMILQVMLGAVREFAKTDAFPAAILFVALAMGLAAKMMGMSPTMGAFLAGVALSDAHWRHDVKEAIGPFEKTLLAFFFLSIGFKLPLMAGGEVLLGILGATLALVAAKTTVGFVAAMASGFGWRDSIRTSMALAQAGEFSIVVLGVAGAAKLVPSSMVMIWTSAAVISMALTPLLVIASDHLASRKRTSVEEPNEATEPAAVPAE